MTFELPKDLPKNPELPKTREELKGNINNSLSEIQKILKLDSSMNEGNLKILEKGIKTMELKINMLNDKYLGKIEGEISKIANNLIFSNISLNNQSRGKIIELFDENNPASILNGLNF